MPPCESPAEPREAARPPVRALVVLDGGRFGDAGGGGRASPRTVGRSDAGFVAHLLVTGDPSLRPSRTERTRSAAALYAEAAQRSA